jgi:crotonobetainyl-CoA:carnitine CoA-transferase CaiB-like acyl-CoA transferase
MTTTTAAGPLAGVTVLDFSAYVAGPYGCALLGDLGARVIKIEPPTGDNLRRYASTLPQESRGFIGVNRSKHGIVIDLKHPRAAAIIDRLVKATDVLVHNFRPDVPERLGIGYERLSDLNPRLVYCAVTGYGEGGPLRDRAGFDQVLQAMTGMNTSQANGGPVPQTVEGSAIDYYAAALVATGVNAALFRREQTGRGDKVGVSLLRTAMTMQSMRLVKVDGEPLRIDRELRAGGIAGIHPTSDGFIYISASADHFWKAFCTHIGRPDLAADPRYDSLRKRQDHAGVLIAEIRKSLVGNTGATWEEIFGADVPCAVVRAVEDMFDDPQVAAENLLETYDHALVGRYTGVARPIDFEAAGHRVPFAAPALGEHTRTVLSDLAFSADEIEALFVAGAVS